MVTQVSHGQAANSNEEDTDVDFAALGAVSTSPNKRSPRPPVSPRAGDASRSPRIVEKKVEVIVEKIPEEHLQHSKALEDYSQAVERERDLFGEQLRAAEEAAEAEKAARLELAQRLEDMQRKLMGHSESAINLSAQGNGSATEKAATDMNLSNYNFLENVPEEGARQQNVDNSKIVDTEGAKKEREAALVRIRERKRKAKKRSENKLRAERERALKENDDIKDELEDLREVAQGTIEDKEEAEKKLNRLKKKYERRVNAMEADRADLVEVSCFTCVCTILSHVLLFLHCSNSVLNEIICWTLSENNSKI